MPMEENDGRFGRNTRSTLNMFVSRAGGTSTPKYQETMSLCFNGEHNTFEETRRRSIEMPHTSVPGCRDIWIVLGSEILITCSRTSQVLVHGAGRIMSLTRVIIAAETRLGQCAVLTNILEPAAKLNLRSRSGFGTELGQSSAEGPGSRIPFLRHSSGSSAPP